MVKLVKLLMDEGGNTVHDSVLSLHPILAVSLMVGTNVLCELPHLAGFNQSKHLLWSRRPHLSKKQDVTLRILA